MEQRQLGYNPTLIREGHYQVEAFESTTLFVSRRAIPIGFEAFWRLRSWIFLCGGAFEGIVCVVVILIRSQGGRKC